MNLTDMRNKNYRLRKNLLAAKRGMAAVELALALPLLIIITFGTIEVTRYVLIAQKLERVSLTLSDLVAQSATITTAQLNQIIPAAGQVLLPYSFATDGYAIISSVTKNGTYPPTINWQYKSSGTAQASNIGTSGGNATIPSGFTMVSGDTVIITEVFYNYKPILSGTIYNSSKMYRYSIYKPRLGNLTVLGMILPDWKLSKSTLSVRGWGGGGKPASGMTTEYRGVRRLVCPS